MATVTFTRIGPSSPQNLLPPGKSWPGYWEESIENDPSGGNPGSDPLGKAYLLDVLPGAIGNSSNFDLMFEITSQKREIIAVQTGDPLVTKYTIRVHYVVSNVGGTTGPFDVAMIIVAP